jgi:hypothetical protein
MPSLQSQTESSLVAASQARTTAQTAVSSQGRTPAIQDDLPSIAKAICTELAEIAESVAALDPTQFSVETGITASTTQTQGQQPLTKTLNEITVCAVANDVVTLPTAVAGLLCVVFNRGAQPLQIFPASGDNIEAGAVDASTTLATVKAALFFAIDSTQWYALPGA